MPFGRLHTWPHPPQLAFDVRSASHPFARLPSQFANPGLHERSWQVPDAHVASPLRRLCDRATNEIVLALVEGRSIPDWARADLELP